MKLSDYVIRFLSAEGIRDVFMVSGGGIIHLVDSLGRAAGMRYYCNHNEQATGYCAEGYARLRNSLAACLVTTGPGSTNAVSGVAGAWVDSVPLLVISGQVKRELIADYRHLRQLGEQEINIVDIVKPITKYAVTVHDPTSIRCILEEAVYLALHGRRGPVWVNIPLDVQGAEVEPDRLDGFVPAQPLVDQGLLTKQVGQVLQRFKQAQHPVLLCGQGIRLAGARDLLTQMLERIPAPVLLSFNGMDLLAEDHTLLVGKPGIIGQRRANFALQNADFLLSLGSRLNIKITGYDYKNFAPCAWKAFVDIDRHEMSKPTLNPDLAIAADCTEFLKETLRQLGDESITIPQEWQAACVDWKKRYPSITPDFLQDTQHVNTYVFYDKLADALSADDAVVSGNGLAALNLYQAFKVKPGQRVFTNNGYGAMGWGLPAAIGVCIARGKERTVCVTGDGSLQMNIQELGLVGHQRLPLKIFVFNNRGYTSIRLTQDNFFNGRHIAADATSGVTNPDFGKVAAAYGLDYKEIENHSQLDQLLPEVLAGDGPVLCELNIAPHQGITPKTTSFRREDGSFESRPLEDMFPFLPREELEENMRFSKTQNKKAGGQ